MIIVIQCKDEVGLVAAIAGLMAQEQINIISMREYVDTEQKLFFARLQLETFFTAEIVHNKLAFILPEGAIIKINPLADKKIAVLVTKEYHCLGDILVRNHFKTLGAAVQCVIGNHTVLEDFCNKFSIPFHFISHEDKSKEQFEKDLINSIEKYEMDYIVLAKFMRILSPQFVKEYAGRIINIHHSFLPAFAGASPYRQAHERGVKIIGATAHFVTNDLDEGPIICQQTIPVTHSFTVTDMVKAGKEIEKAALSKAMQLVFEDRVFVYNNKTVVFE